MLSYYGSPQWRRQHQAPRVKNQPESWRPGSLGHSRIRMRDHELRHQSDRVRLPDTGTRIARVPRAMLDPPPSILPLVKAAPRVYCVDLVLRLIGSWIYLIMGLSSCTQAPSSGAATSQHLDSGSHPQKCPQASRRSRSRDTTGLTTAMMMVSRPLENHFYLDTELFVETDGGHPNELAALTTKVRVVSYDSSKCGPTKPGAHATGPWRRHPFRSFVSYELARYRWTPRQIENQLARSIPSDFSAPIVVSDIYVLDLTAWGFSRRAGSVLPFHQHILSPEASKNSTLFWRIGEERVCDRSQSGFQRDFASIGLGNTGFGLLVSQGQNLGDYWSAPQDWTKSAVGWPKVCLTGRSAQPPAQPASLDFPALSSSVAFGGARLSSVDKSIKQESLGLSCENAVEIRHRMGMLAGVRSEAESNKKNRQKDLILRDLASIKQI